MMWGTKAEMGVGTLIVFIAMLLVAAVAAGVLIQTAGSLQEKSLMTGTQARDQIATNAETVEVSATDGTDTEVDYFEQIIKLAPGSSSIKLAEVILTMNTYTSTATLKYRGTNGTFYNTFHGYNTYREEDLGAVNTSWIELDDDLDDDGSYDYVRILGLNGIALNLSSDGIIVGNISGANNWSSVNKTMSGSTTLSDGDIDYATVEVEAYMFTASTVAANQTFNVTPVENFGKGYFSVEYLQQGQNFVVGNLQRGDVIKLYYEAPEPIGESEEVRLNFLPKIGTPTLTQFVTPDVMSVERVYLYP